MTDDTHPTFHPDATADPFASEGTTGAEGLRAERPAGVNPADVLPWWFRALYPGESVKVLDNPVFLALCRRAMQHRQSPARLMRSDTWYRREGGFHRLLGDLHSTGVTADEVIVGSLAAASAGKGGAKRAAGPSPPPSALDAFIDWFVAFVTVGVVVMVGVYAVQSTGQMGSTSSAAAVIGRASSDARAGYWAELVTPAGQRHLLVWALMVLAIWLLQGFVWAESHAWAVQRRLFWIVKREWQTDRWLAGFFLNVPVMVILLFVAASMSQVVRESGMGLLTVFDRLFLHAPREWAGSAMRLGGITWMLGAYTAAVAFLSLLMAAFVLPRYLQQTILARQLNTEMAEMANRRASGEDFVS